MSPRILLGCMVFLTGLNGAAAQDKPLPALRATEIKVGESYVIDGGGMNTWGRIIEIIDDENMLIGIDNGAVRPGGTPRYSVTVWCKFPTKGLADGKSDFLGNILGTSKLTASGTTRYKTPAGSNRTVFILEPYGKAKK